MVLRRFVLGGFLSAGACGDDEASDGEGTSPTSVASQSTSDSSTGTDPTSGTDPTTSTSASSTSDATEDSTSTVADSSSGDTDVEVPCGDGLILTCFDGDVCVEDAFGPECTNLEDPNGMCPDGQNMTNCGGAGFPCCCLPPPASDFRCVTPTECIGPADCDCLGEALCTMGRVCISLGVDPEHFFRCEYPPDP